jgi:hypothetical protein
MNPRTIVLAAMATCGMAAYAQVVTPRIETGFDYTFTRVNPGGFYLSSYSAQGGSGFVEYNVNPMLGLVADVGANYVGVVSGFALDNTTFTFLFGPRVNWRKPRWTIYGQTLVGGARFSDAYDPALFTPIGGTPVSQITFAAAIGGGADYRLTSHIAIKPIQVEYLMTQLPGRLSKVNEVQNNLRYSAGIVFRFGAK